MKCTLVISLVALASAGFMEKKETTDAHSLVEEAQKSAAAAGVKKQEEIAKTAESSHMSSAASQMHAQAMGQLAFYQTEEGKKVHEKAIKAAHASYLEQAADEMQWFADVAKDGFIEAGGSKFPLFDPKSREGLLPKSLPDFPTDPVKRKEFVEMLPVDQGTYQTMLSLKKDPKHYMDIAKDKFKDMLSSLQVGEAKTDDFFGTKTPQSMLQSQQTVNVEEAHQKSIEVLKASPKAFKVALKAWEKLVPEAASMLLQTEVNEGFEQNVDQKPLYLQARELSNRATVLHQTVVESVEKVDNKDKLMAVAQNRITSLLMRQSEATLGDFDALEGCTGAAKDYSGAESRCLCVADNVCSKAGQAHHGDYCSLVSSATCMAPKNDKEASEDTIV